MKFFLDAQFPPITIINFGSGLLLFSVKKMEESFGDNRIIKANNYKANFNSLTNSQEKINVLLMYKNT